MSAPGIFALFQKRIAGDDALLALARHRFREAGLLPEFYVSDLDERRALRAFHPFPERKAVLHLPRGLNLLDSNARDFIVHLAGTDPGEILGMVVHDQNEIHTDFDRYIRAVREIDRRLRRLSSPPFLFLEYAVGLDPDLFCRTIEAAGDLPAVSACIDIGHIGIHRAREAYGETHAGRTLDALTVASEETLERLPDIRDAVRAALPATLAVIRRLAEPDKPLHFHLHDGHPLVENHYGVPDHKSFPDKITLPAPGGSTVTLDPLYGPAGLKAVIDTARRNLGPSALSFTLEIHETLEQRPLEPEVRHLFGHWHDTTNAEKTNHWLNILVRNAALVTEICAAGPPAPDSPVRKSETRDPESTIQNPKSKI